MHDVAWRGMSWHVIRVRSKDAQKQLGERP